MFNAVTVFPGVTHITDAMGVSFTLIEGKERALLFDTGYGTENVSGFIGSMTDKPVSVILSHGHHDHILGTRWFSECFLCKEDLKEFRQRTGKDQRMKVAAQAEQKGLAVPDDYLDAPVPEPIPLAFGKKQGRFEQRTEDLGERQVQIIHVPGHTPGSIVLYLEDLSLLITGDDWNPCTWMWFPSSSPVRVWRDNMKELVRTLEAAGGREILHVLCSHQPALRRAAELKEFLAYMTDERIDSALPVDTGTQINACEIRKEPEGWTLRFDRDK